MAHSNNLYLGRDLNRRLSNPSDKLPFQSLHIDIHLTIVQFLEPVDVISLGTTCKTLREASVQRSVWIPILNRICEANGLFKPTYSLPQMSVLEIQRVAFSPARMISLYNKHLCSSDRSWPPISERIILPNVLDNAGNFTRYLFLIPGGRFLVSYSGYWRQLCVWNLSAGSTSTTDSQPLVKWNYRLEMPITCSPDTTGTAIRIAALARPLSEELFATLQYHVFECQLGLPQPMTKVYYTVEPPYEGDLMLRFMSGDIFSEIRGPCVYMWNIVRNVWICWKHALKTVKTAFIDRGKLILIGLDSIQCWKIPGYRAWGPFNMLMPIDFPPYSTSSINQPSSPSYHLTRNHLSVYRTASSWYNGQSVFPFLFDIIEAGSSSEYFTVTYDVRDDNKEKIDVSATALIQDLNYGDLPIAWDSWRMLDGQIYKCLSNYDTIQLVVSGNKVTKAADKVYSYYDPVVNLTHSGDNILQYGDFSFDPMSGRLCYASLSDEGSIAVLDFLCRRP